MKREERIRNIDWSQFDLKFDDEGNPTIILKRTNKPVPAHLINGRYLAICVKETNNVLFHRAVFFINEVKNGRTPDYRVEIHHKDGNRLNNSLANLEALSVEDHVKIHRQAMIGRVNQGIRDKWKNDTTWREKMLKVLANNRDKWNKKREAKHEAEEL